LQKALNPSRKVDFHISPGQALSVVKDLPEGEYDLVVGVKLDVVNQTLAGVYETHAWPNKIKPEDAGLLFTLGDLRAFSDDIPNTDGLEVGALHLTAAPRAVFANEDRLLVSQPFKLDIDLVQTGFPRRTTISTLDGTFRWNLRVGAEQDTVDVEKLKINFVSPGGVTEASTSQLEVSRDSPVQPRDAASLQALTNAVTDKVILKLLSESFTISPVFTLPLGDGVSLRVQRVDVRAIRTLDGIGALMVGVLIGTKPEPDAGSGSPDRLSSAPFTSAISNVYFRVHEALANKLAQEAIDSGALASKLPDLEGALTIKLESASVDFREPNKLGLKVRAKLEDFCGPGPFNLKDLHFDVLTDLELVPGLNSQVSLVPGDVDIDFDDSDQVVCAIFGAIDLLTVVFGVDTIGELLIVILFKIFGPGSVASKLAVQVEAIFDPKDHIPFTELAPKGEITQAVVSDDALEALGTLTLSRDDLHTYIYLRVLQSSTPPIAGTGHLSPPGFQPVRPLKDARVEAIDQDAPAPPGDDVIVPKPRTIVVKDDKTKTVFLDIRYEPPQSNELLDKGKTDEDGLVNLVTNRATKGGKIIFTRRFKSKPQKPLDEVKEGIISKTENLVTEQRSDLFFRITLPNGKVFDTRTLPGQGLFFQPNFNRRRIGDPDAPLDLVLFIAPVVKQ
jgi:hypothetical protein